MLAAAPFRVLDRPRVALAVSALVFLVPVLFVLAIPHPLEQPLGVDATLYRDAAARWWSGGPFYEPRQLAGPYEVTPGDILYPPVGLWLFVPFALLPAVVALRPVVARAGRGHGRGRSGGSGRARVVWPLIALCLAWPTTPLKVWTGNPVIWCVAAMAIATAWRGAAPFALLKPSLFPFALFGIRDRSWWLGLAVFAALCLPFGTMWVDWVATVLNSRGGGLLYSILEAPMLALPLVAWLGRTRPPVEERHGRLTARPARICHPRTDGPPVPVETMLLDVLILLVALLVILFGAELFTNGIEWLAGDSGWPKARSGRCWRRSGPRCPRR